VGLLLAGLAAVPPLLRPWLCDDAFITFRYVERAAAGLGLTYNPGERVEGFTHFLWAILLWALREVGVGVEGAGRYLPILSYAASVVVLAGASVRLFRREGSRLGWLPLGSILWAVHHEAHLFASGGLETSAYTLFLVLGFLLVTRPARGVRAAALAYSLAALTRPEGLLHAVLAWCFLVFQRRRDARFEVHAGKHDFAVMVLVLVLPLFVFRLLYYGDLLPNAFYAKSAGRPYWSQGLFYVGLYFQYYAPLALGLVAGTIVARRFGGMLGLALAHAVAVLGMTAYVGGDFMFARFLLPATPFLCLLCEAAVRALPRGRTVAAVALVVAVVGGGMWRERSLHGLNVARRGIADERSQYPEGMLAERARQGRLLQRCFGGTQAVFLVQGSQASLAYYGRFPVAIEAYGLTDRTIARAPLGSRGRPGHERRPSLEYLLARRTNFLVHLPGARAQRPFARIEFGDLVGEIVVYDHALMEKAGACPEVRFTDFPAFFDAWCVRAAALAPEERERDAAAFRLYYFDHNADPARAARLASLAGPR
jgi:hypothetical protein